MKKWWILLVLGLMLSVQAFAQLGVSPLKYNPVLFEVQESRKTTIQYDNFIYIIDSLPIPFLDDFSRDRTKKYNAQPGDANVSITENFAFTVDGIYIDSIRVRFDTTRSYIKKLDGSIDTTPNPALEILFFNPEIPSDTDTIITAWQSISSFFIEGSGTPPSVTELTPDAVYYNSRDTVFVVADDNSHWVKRDDQLGGSAPFINNTYSADPPTVGMATFDGLDALGRPYDDSDLETFGGADTLLSKPFLLDPLMLGVYLSFYYQSQGLGDAPDSEDSLILDFYSPITESWNTVWGVEGPEEFTSFENQVFVPVDDFNYLQKGFRFRFRNKATLSGNFDHWNIDYIRLGENRHADTATGVVIDDMALLFNSPSLLEEYTSVPWRHYLANPSACHLDEFMPTIRNLDSLEKFVTHRYFVYDEGGTELFASNPVTLSAVESWEPTEMTVPITTPGTIFPDNGEECGRFIVENRVNAVESTNATRDNDTVRNVQEFCSYYAYDDGTAELAADSKGVGFKIAYEFDSKQEDTLRAILINFPQTLEDYTTRAFRIFVWSSLAPEEVLYESETVSFPVYSNRNEFVRYEIKEDVVVDGVFYIGWEQIQAQKLYIGFDVNNDNGTRIWSKKTSAGWKNNQIQGSFMMRVDFDKLPEPPVSVTENPTLQNDLNIKVFPNPANQQIQIRQEGITQPLDITMFDLQGKGVRNVNSFTDGSIDIADLPPGVYLMRVFRPSDQKTVSRKIMIAR